MENIKHALAASIISRGCAALLVLLVTPVYIRYLSIEAYGVIGLFASLSALLAFLDFGLGASLVREFSTQSSSRKNLSLSRDLTRTFEVFYLGIALIIGVCGFFLIKIISQYWIQPNILAPIEVTYSLGLASVALACQWPSTLYSSPLAGLHKHIQLVIALVLLAIFRITITLIAIDWNPSLKSFFFAQIISGILQTIILRTMLWHALSLEMHRPSFKPKIIRKYLSFAGDMTAITIISIVLTQADKIILSRTSSLYDFGVYIAASTIAAGLYMIISPIFSVMFPRFSAMRQEVDDSRLCNTYFAANQVMAVLLLPISAVIACSPQDVLYLWTADRSLSEKGAPILMFIIIGNTLNGLLNIPYALQLAHGWTRLALLINSLGLLFLIPSIWWASTVFGPVGGAGAWATLNAAYFFVWPYLLHKRLLKQELFKWYVTAALLPTFLVIVIAEVVKVIVFKGSLGTRVETAIYILAAWAVSFLALSFVLPHTRRFIFNIIVKTINRTS